MPLRYLSDIIRLTASAIFFFVAFGSTSQGFAAPPRLPNVSPEMERPGFWVKKIENPAKPLLTPDKIQKMNEENLQKQTLGIYRIRDLKETWSREEILSFLKADWESFGKNEEVRYGKSGARLGESFWNKLRSSLCEELIQETDRMLFALVVKRTDIRIFPTDEPSMRTPNQQEFDLFQQSSISPGSPVGIYYFTQDKKWAYVQTQFIRGWIHTHDLAVAKRKSDIADYEEAKDRLVVSGNLVTVFGDFSFRDPAFTAQMGDSFPLFTGPGRSKAPESCYVIQIGARESNGSLTIRKGYVRGNEDVHPGFLPYTQENIARQAFKMLHHPYGWGDRLGGRDCSRFIMDLFRAFGILMPRNSNEQAGVGKDLGSVEGASIREKQKFLDRSIPLATTLRLPGHIILYLGEDRGRYYVIHSISGIQKSGKDSPAMQKIGRVVVSDLSVGEKGPNRSLLDRITDVRVIGPIPEIQEK